MTKLWLTVLPVLALSALSACSHSGGVKGFEKDEVLSTVDGKDQPEWADETRPVQFKDGTVYSVGVAEIKGDERPQAGARVAENNARISIAKMVQNKMEGIFQNAEEGMSYDSNAAKFIGSEMTSLTTHSMKNERMWWKRVAQSNEDGARVIRYKIYSLVTMPKGDLKAAIHEAVAKASGQGKLSPSFQAQVDRQWSHFVEGDTGANRSTASQSQ